MILLLDVGNTRMKWALWDGARLTGFGAVAHGGDPGAAFDSRPWPATQAIWIAQVAGSGGEAPLAQRVETRTGTAPRFARCVAERDGLRVAYSDPSRLGVDRWLAMLALWVERRGAFCVVGAGTALTFDRVASDGRHLGGVIAPGFGSMQQALADVTRSGPADSRPSYSDTLGRDTHSGIRQGAFFAAMGVIEKSLRAPELLGAGPEVRFISGGDATALLPHLGADWEHRPHLVLEGLKVLACSQ